MKRTRRVFLAGMVLGLVGAIGASPAMAGSSFIEPLNTITTIRSTVPSNGDVNPYGVAVVPRSMGHLRQGWVLVSNFNAASNLQGTGTTIVEIARGGARRLFAQIDPGSLPGPCPGGVGLTTALAVLQSGWVIVGSLPTTDGTATTSGPGCLLVLNNKGKVRETISGMGINGPWDMTAADDGSSAALFVTNVLRGTVAGGGSVVNKGTVLRIDLSIPARGLPTVASNTVIGSKFGERTDPAALVVGPTGVGLGADGTLYVADSVANRVASIPNALGRTTSAGTGTTVTTGGSLNTPLGLAVAPNADVLTMNAGDGNIVETTPSGTQVAVKTLDSSGDPPGAGTLFGLAVTPENDGLYFVDDGTNTLNLLH